MIPVERLEEIAEEARAFLRTDHGLPTNRRDPDNPEYNQCHIGAGYVYARLREMEEESGIKLNLKGICLKLQGNTHLIAGIGGMIIDPTIRQYDKNIVPSVFPKGWYPIDTSDAEDVTDIFETNRICFPRYSR